MGKQEDTKIEDLFRIGEYCENCKEWMLTTTISKADIDEAIYEIFYTGGNITNFDVLEFISKENNMSIGKVKELLSVKNGIIFQGKAPEIIDFAGKLLYCNIEFQIIPDFPHKISKYKDMTEILESAQLRSILYYLRKMYGAPKLNKNLEENLDIDEVLDFILYNYQLDIPKNGMTSIKILARYIYDNFK